MFQDDVVLGLCEKLQLQDSLYKLAVERYETISSTLQEDEVFKYTELRIYSQGSFRLKTTVKPIKDNEFDLDFVVELPESSAMTPLDLYNHIYRILSSDGNHNNMVEKKNRCIRINYKNDFHMDIMPGKAINRNTNEIIVPDRELKSWWHHSNPIGYAEWFEMQAKTNIKKSLFARGIISESAEPINEQEVVKKLEPLRRAVQLIKRYRDVFCDKNNCNPTKSIVLCTLIGFVVCDYSNEWEIIDDFCKYVNMQIRIAGNKPFVVKNPVVDEILTEKWYENRQNYYDFVSMISKLTDDVSALRKLTNNIEIAEKMKSMFGEKIIVDVVKSLASTVDSNRFSGSLTVNSKGELGVNPNGISVGKNTFYGE